MVTGGQQPRLPDSFRVETGCPCRVIGDSPAGPSTAHSFRIYHRAYGVRILREPTRANMHLCSGHLNHTSTALLGQFGATAPVQQSLGPVQGSNLAKLHLSSGYTKLGPNLVNYGIMYFTRVSCCGPRAVERRSSCPLRRKCLGGGLPGSAPRRHGPGRFSFP